MTTVMVSYSRQDATLRQQLVSDLLTAGVRPIADTELRPGEPSWQKWLERSIEASDAVVALLTPASKQSEWVEREVGYAQMHQVPIVPCLAAGDERTSIPIALQGVQFVDLRSYQRGLSELVGALKGGAADLPRGASAGALAAGGPNLITIQSLQEGAVSRYPYAWRWDGLVNRPQAMMLSAGHTVMSRMGLKKLRPVGPAVLSGVQKNLFGTDVVLSFGSVPQTAVTAIVSVSGYTTNLVTGKGRVRDAVREVAAGLHSLSDEANAAQRAG